MSKNVMMSSQSQDFAPQEEKRALEHMILRDIVESEDLVFKPETQSAVLKLRELCKRFSKDREAKAKADPVLIAFGTIVITAAAGLITKVIEDLLKPPVGFATVYNPGPPVKVWTYDETDGVRWIAFREYSIGTNEAVPLTARGNNAIQVVIVGKPTVHTLAKGQAYGYDGNVMQPRTV